MKSVDVKLMLGIVLAMLPFGISCADEAEEPPLCEPRVFEPVQDLPVDLLGDWRFSGEEGPENHFARFSSERFYQSWVGADGAVETVPPMEYLVEALTPPPEVYWILYTTVYNQIIPPPRVAQIHERSIPEYIQFEQWRLLPVTCPDSLFDLESPAIPLPEAD